MIKAPRGHTSIYFSDYLKANISTLHQVMNETGFTSFNGFFNKLITDAIHTHDGKKTLKKPLESSLAFGDVVSKVRPRLARGPWKSDVRKSVLCICCAAVHLDFAFGIA